MQWINPDVELPPVTSQVLIAIGISQNLIEDHMMAYVGSSGAFCINNGPYTDNCLYSEKSPHRASNAYRVIAWSAFEKCDLDTIIEPEKAPKEGEEGYGLYQYLKNKG